VRAHRAHRRLPEILSSVLPVGATLPFKMVSSRAAPALQAAVVSLRPPAVSTITYLRTLGGGFCDLFC
jgi:hypothetical protein